MCAIAVSDICRSGGGEDVLAHARLPVLLRVLTEAAANLAGRVVASGFDFREQPSITSLSID